MNNGEELTGERKLSAPNGMTVMDVIARRVSCRAYKTDPVPRELVPQIA